MLNRDIYVKAPEQNRLINNGVAEVSEDHSDAAVKTLRFELESFVCDGQYEKGLETILSTFLHHLASRTEQPGVWVSGFYGSGKSHLAKVTRYLWTDHAFPDGVTARGLTTLPSGVTDALKELTTAGKRHGGLHAAAGKLGAAAGGNVRLAVLSVIFRSAGLPEQYPHARFVMWLKQEGLLDAVQAGLKAAGRTLEQELPNFYVSPHLAKALLKAFPGFAESDSAARGLLKAQYPQFSDISDKELSDAVTLALSANKKFPLTLVVLDEVQQYIGDDAERAYQVQLVTETLCKHFAGQLLFVGTGQSALSGTPNLQRLMARFPISVMLGDWDVENVTRKIILAKKPTAQAAVEKAWRANLGEISRHLRGTKLEHVTDDEAVMTVDYPILPVRRRFWERVLRSIDTTGTVAQLRSQLRVVHEAVVATADLPIGHVVAGDFLYDQIAASLVATAQLPREVFENVHRFASGDERAQLKGRLLRLIFLINKLPPEVAHDVGIAATENVLADLLVSDLGSGSAALRKTLPPLLEELQHKDRLVMVLDGSQGKEYRLQTRESSSWDEEFRAQVAELKATPQRIEVQRADLFKARFNETLAKLKLTQGKTSEARHVRACFDETLPKDHGQAIYVWCQSGWQTDEKSVIADAKALGNNDPTVVAFLPKEHSDALTNAMVSLAAATSTLHRKGTPNTEEGRDAQRAIESRQRTAEKEIADLLDKLFGGVRIFQAGGQEVTAGSTLGERLNQAASASVVRLYRDFDTADHTGWSKALEEARKGNAEALKAVGHTQEADKHPVCQKLIAFIGPGKKGAELRNHFEGAPYGWPRDAIDGALYALLTTGHLRATDVAGKPVDGKNLDRSKLTQASFRVESVTISPVQLIKIRGLFNGVGVPCQPKEELEKSALFIAQLEKLATAAGGDPPRPAVPNLEPVHQLKGQSGNGLLLAIHTAADELKALAAQWDATGKAIVAKLPAWQELNALLRHAADLASYEELSAECDAIVAQRGLLESPDPVRPLLDRTADALRQALNAKVDGYAAEYEAQMQGLAADANWQKLSGEQRGALLAQHHVEPPKKVNVATSEALLDALEDCDLGRWIERTQALASRFDAIRWAAAQLLAPNVVRVALPKRTLNGADDVEAWLAEVRALLLEKVAKGPVTL